MERDAQLAQGRHRGVGAAVPDPAATSDWRRRRRADIRAPHLVKTRRRRPKQLKLFEKERPGDFVQLDVKVIARGRTKWFQYTAIDDCACGYCGYTDARTTA
jgi:hypothetical protein